MGFDDLARHMELEPVKHAPEVVSRDPVPWSHTESVVTVVPVMIERSMGLPLLYLSAWLRRFVITCSMSRRSQLPVARASLFTTRPTLMLTVDSLLRRRTTSWASSARSISRGSITSLPAATVSSVVMNRASRRNDSTAGCGLADVVRPTVRCIRSIEICSLESGLRSSCDVMERNTSRCSMVARAIR